MKKKLEREHHDQRGKDIKKHEDEETLQASCIMKGNSGTSDWKNGICIMFCVELGIFGFILLPVRVLNKLEVQLDLHF